MKKEWRDLLEDSPVIAAVKNEEGLERCLESDCRMVFVLYGDVCSIDMIVRRLKEKGKFVLVHLDLVSGLSGKEAAVRFIGRFTDADGVLTTKPALIAPARELGLMTVLRFFVIDSMACTSIVKQVSMVHPDVIEIMPGVIAGKVIRSIRQNTKCQLIAGGLISDREDVVQALKAGAAAVSTTNENVWFM